MKPLQVLVQISLIQCLAAVTMDGIAKKSQESFFKKITGNKTQIKPQTAVKLSRPIATKPTKPLSLFHSLSIQMLAAL